MSWKSIELQVAIPRTQDASKQQDLSSKQGQRFQEALSQSQLQENVRKRQQVQKFEKIDKTKESLKKDHAKEEAKDLTDEEENQDQDERTNHPYLGSHIDFSG